MNESPIRIMIVDDHAIVRTGISTWIESKEHLQLIGEAENGQDAVEKAIQLKPDVILMDLVMPKMDGIQATRAILAQVPKVKILIITSFSEKERAVEAIRSGAIGFVMKDTSPQELLDAITSVSKGRPWLSAELTRMLVQQQSVSADADMQPGNELLTEREQDVLRLVAKGYSDQEIAEKMFVSKGTVRYHLNNILSKLNLENRTQVALYAIKKGLVTF